ncbi:MAG: hypothetical protein ACREQ5_30845, partial [Candidatus Dormibacteria bacterium]
EHDRKTIERRPLKITSKDNTMKTLDQHPQTTTKITNSVRPSYPDPVGRDLAFRSDTGKIKGASC